MSKGSFTKFEDALRAFESGVNPDTLASGWAINNNVITAADLERYNKGQISLRELQYTSVNSLGFVGYQVGEALMIDLGYYKDDVFYGHGANTNTWDGTFTGKGGVTSLAALKTSLQEGVMLAAFGFNLEVIEDGLAATGQTLTSFIGKTTSYMDNGQTISVTLSLTGILAAAHLRGAWGTLALLQNGAVSSDENGTSILRYIDMFGGYDPIDRIALKSAYTSGKTLQLAETIWNKDFDKDGQIGSSNNITFDGRPGDETFDGRGKVATIDYSDATGGVHVKLGTSSPQAIGGGQGKDKLLSIENVTGSKFNDTIVGNPADNFLNGRAGRDSLTGGSGKDTLVGGDGKDTLIGGSGRDLMSGNARASTSSDGDRDTFRFVAIADSTVDPDTYDHVWGNFSGNRTFNKDGNLDVIDLSAIDTNGSATGGKGDEGTFKLVSKFTASGTGELLIGAKTDKGYLVSIDTDADSKAEMSFLVHASKLAAGDFIL